MMSEICGGATNCNKCALLEAENKGLKFNLVNTIKMLKSCPKCEAVRAEIKESIEADGKAMKAYRDGSEPEDRAYEKMHKYAMIRFHGLLDWINEQKGD